MQLLQFMLALTHGTIGYLYHGFCFYSMLYGWAMIALFSNFYYHAFILKKRSKGDAGMDRKLEQKQQ